MSRTAMRRSRSTTVLACVAGLTAAVVIGPMAGTAGAHHPLPSGAEAGVGLIRPAGPAGAPVEVLPGGPCGDATLTGVAAGRAECLHEDTREHLPPPPDPIPAGDGTDEGLLGPSSQEESTVGPPCIGDGTSGHRVRAVYARPADRPDRYAQVVEEIRAWAVEVSDVFRASAAQTGGEREVRWLMPDCDLQVDHVVLSAQGDDSIAATRAEMRALGYTNDQRKYLVWMDSDVICGQGYLFVDDRPEPDANNNNLLASFSRVDSGLRADGTVDPGGPTTCWGYAEAHELTHNLGAVQRAYTDGLGEEHPGAPNQTPSFHCTDEWDLMCYDDDGPGPVAVQIVCPDPSLDVRLDCNDDDYFYAAPPPVEPEQGEQPPPPTDPLEGRWNTADSYWLEGGAEPPTVVPSPPPANDDFVAAAPIEGYRTLTEGTTAGATAEDGEPAHAGTRADHSAWWSWPAPTNGEVTVGTTPTSPEPFSGAMVPELAVYTGESLESLAPVATEAELDAAGRQTSVTFTVEPGTTYWIAADDWDQQAAPLDLTTGPPPNPYPDVTPAVADVDAVDWMNAVGITNGYDDGSWKPANQLNRQQVAAFFYRLAGQPTFTPPSYSQRTFTDVGAGHAFYLEVEWLATSGITTGYSDGTFRSLTTLNRQQVATFLYRAAGATATSTAEPFDDVTSGHPFHREITWAFDQGLMDATSSTTFSSLQTMTRATLADAMHRLAGSEQAWEATPPPTVWFVTG